ncbi:Uncharacterised protein [Mycobacteroides abscessus subsp. abscessus]|nr:Uncharacterised protein [Mycobacteroides abscessus subsp. abscessus]
MHRGHHHVQLVEQLGGLVQRAVVEDVDLNAPQDAHLTGDLHLLDLGPLLLQAFGAEAVGDAQSGRVVGDGLVLAAQAFSDGHHLGQG